MSDLAYEIVARLCRVLASVPLGTNRGLFTLLWAVLSALRWKGNRLVRFSPCCGRCSPDACWPAADPSFLPSLLWDCRTKKCAGPKLPSLMVAFRRKTWCRPGTKPCGKKANGRRISTQASVRLFAT